MRLIVWFLGLLFSFTAWSLLADPQNHFAYLYGAKENQPSPIQIVEPIDLSSLFSHLYDLHHLANDEALEKLKAAKKLDLQDPKFAPKTSVDRQIAENLPVIFEIFDYGFNTRGFLFDFPLFVQLWSLDPKIPQEKKIRMADLFTSMNLSKESGDIRLNAKASANPPSGLCSTITRFLGNFLKI